ncbi:SusC/RagA family TonB-linked outer membrane protein [Bacteroides sp. MSK.17.76]|uniref:SusC/RagA family TonB-linked outer membrane protein n=1 Tax=Bacteroides sp. MSK.17.76 TaxID=2849168 RepID=UPI001C37A0E6|nr:SusC/RagA family TonB-linked outer membrane protein [Bacteroides sp. MSK.17.76]MBV3775636.1 SusC/RagA family TonB-linked outer membrane protein [Bacteroides sp. MSK.17.76]
MESKHSLRKSKLFRALLILLLIAVPVQWAAAQLTLSTPRTTLGTVIKQIQSQSKYQFFYNDKLSTVTVEPLKVKDASLEQVLNTLLKNKDISYKIEENIIYLSEKENSDSLQQQSGKERTITGQVVDAKGEPLIGVSILVKGTTDGAITDLDGNYKIVTKSNNPVIVYSYIGYKTQEIPLKGQTAINITMMDDTQVIDEVVVTALGIKRSEKALSYNVTQVDAESALAVKDANFINSLNGKVAGLNINSSSSGIGGASKVVMRGSRGIEQSSNALYVIDGIPMYNLSASGGSEEMQSQGSTEAIADINPDDIESMSVLSGAAAALYGSNASNGAIVITTKKGKVGRVALTVSSNTEMLSPFVMPQFQNRYGTSGTDASWGKRLNEANYRGYDPASDYFQTGLIGTESVTLSTGTEHNQTYLSAAAVNSRGIIPNNKYDRYNFTFRNTTLFLEDKMKLDVGAQYIMQKDRNMVNQGIYANPLSSAYLFPRGNDWEDYKMYERYDLERNMYTQYWPQGGGSFRLQNPYWINYRNLRENDKDRYMLSAALSYDILSWLNVAGRVRLDNSYNTYTQKYYASTIATIAEGENGFYGVTNTRDKQTYADLLLNINKTFGEDWSLTANIGASYSDNRSEALAVSGPIAANGLPNFFTVAQLDKETGKREETGYREQTQSIFASAEVGYRSTYYLTLTGRNDWPSQLAGPNSKQSSFFYPSVGGSVVLSELFKLPESISYLKLRASWASVGLPFGRFLAYPTFSWNTSTGAYSSQSAYPLYDLKPERTDSWEVGLTARFLKHFNFDVSFYNTKTYNQTMDAKLSPTGGYSTFYAQTGNVRNRGVELSLGYKNTWNKFSWSSNYTFSANKNKILSLIDGYINPVTGEEITKDRMDVGGLSKARFILKVGGSLGDLYSQSDLLRDSNNKIYVNADGNVAVNDKADDIYLGSVFPKANMAWRNDFQYGNWGLGFLLTARLGGVVYSATQAVLDSYGVSEATAAARDNGGVVINGNDMIDAQKWYTVVGADSGIPQYYTYSATNLRLQEASVSYTIPRKKLKNIMDITLSLVGRNLWMIYCKAPFDPESVATTGNYYQGIDYFMMPSLRSVGFNLKLKF